MSAVAAESTAAPTALAKAINAGLAAALERDDKVMLMGEDIGQLGGVFRVTDGLHARFGSQRVVDTPLAESGIIGTAIGLAMAGYRPVCEIQFDGFVFPGFDQITSQLAKIRYRSAGRIALPLVIRIPFGGGIGSIEHHSESPEALFAHTPGLRVVSPASPGDAFTMIQQAIASPDPVIFFEPKARYWQRAPLDVTAEVDLSAEGIAEGLHRARVVRPGRHVTVAGYGPTVTTLLAAAEAAAEEGQDLEVIDLRSLSPLDVPTVIDSVNRTGRLVVAHEASTFYGPGAELAAQVTEHCFHRLEAPVLRVGGFHTPYPAGAIETEFLPNLDRVLDAVDRSLAY